MAHIKLSKANFFYNLDKISKQAGSIDKVALVLKDNAYGHGLTWMASLAAGYGISKAIVQTDDKAQAVKRYFDYVLVLADFPKNQTPSGSSRVRYAINDINAIEQFPKGTQVELKVNTGMNRNGIEMSELDEAIKRIETQGLILEAIFTHFACADEIDGNYDEQKRNFEIVKKNSPSGLRFHSCNSAALFREDNFSEDMARVGIAAYGCLELPPQISKEEFKPVLSLYANKISSRELKKGASIGYGASYTLDTDATVSNYDIGYGDGFLRSLSNVYKTPDSYEIAGRVSMDNSSFISDKDELLIFDDAREVAKLVGTISYEVLTSLKPCIKREVV